MSKLLVVTGATGNQGGSIIKAVLADPELRATFKIRGVTRDSKKPAAEVLKEKGVEVVEANFSEPETVRAAFKGADFVFAVTNYWDTYNKDAETKQGNAMVDAAKAEGVKHFIWSGLTDVNKLTNGKLSNVYHFDSKAAVEEHLVASGLPYTAFYAGFYMQNFTAIPALAIKKNSSGEWQLNLPCKPTAQFPLFDVDDTGNYITPILKNPSEYLGKRVYSGKYYSAQETVDIVSKVAGGSGKGVLNTISEDEFKSRFPVEWPDFVKDEMAENMKLLEQEYGYYGGAELDSHLGKVGGKVTAFEEWVEKNKAALEKN